MKKISVFLLLVVMTLFCVAPVFAVEKTGVSNNEQLKVVYFYSSKCLACQSNKAFIANLEKVNGINLVSYNVDEVDCSSIQVAYAEHFGVKEADSLHVPYIYYADKACELIPSNHNQVLNEILDYVETGNFENFEYDESKCQTNIFENFLKNMTIPGILLAGLIDGINPCAISMLMVFYSFLILTENKKKIIGMSSLFITGIFLANFLFGLGVKTFYDAFAGNRIVLYCLYGAAISMCIVAITLNTIDIINSKKNIAAKNQLPDKIKYFLGNVLQGSVFSRFSIIIALFVGFLVGVVELACTGQIYFPTLTYMIQSTNYGIESILLLIAYNIMFVLPLIVITVIAGVIKEPEQIKNKIMSKNWLIKLIANVFFVIMIFILIKQIINV